MWMQLFTLVVYVGFKFVNYLGCEEFAHGFSKCFHL